MPFIICHKYCKDVSPQFFYCFYSTGLLLVPQISSSSSSSSSFSCCCCCCCCLDAYCSHIKFCYRSIGYYCLYCLLSSWLLDPVVEDDGVPHWFLWSEFYIMAQSVLIGRIQVTVCCYFYWWSISHVGYNNNSACLLLLVMGCIFLYIRPLILVWYWPHPHSDLWILK